MVSSAHANAAASASIEDCDLVAFHDEPTVISRHPRVGQAVETILTATHHRIGTRLQQERPIFIGPANHL